MAKFAWKTFIGGFLLGTVGLDLMKSEEADKVYTALATASLVSKDWVMKRYEYIGARSQDILAEAKQINAERAHKAEAEFIGTEVTEP